MGYDSSEDANMAFLLQRRTVIGMEFTVFMHQCEVGVV
jgi:hypothetical protein